jgi:hypothetical protein
MNFSIQFCIDESKFKDLTYEKKYSVSPLIPGDSRTYVYNTEEAYYKQYTDSYYAYTMKKGGWDCMRHYEIIAAGCIPYFSDLEKCQGPLFLFPKDLILKAMNLKGLVFNNGLSIDFTSFDKNEYYNIRDQLYNYAKTYLTNTYMSLYILSKVDISCNKILYLTGTPDCDYQTDLLLPGFKKNCNTVDYPKREYLYKSYKEDTSKLYGRGFSYTKIIEDEFCDRSNISERIKNKEFDIIIYGSVHKHRCQKDKGLPFIDIVRKYYKGNIIFICGEDFEHCHDICKNYDFVKDGFLFIREFNQKCLRIPEYCKDCQV